MTSPVSGCSRYCITENTRDCIRARCACSVLSAAFAVVKNAFASATCAGVEPTTNGSMRSEVHTSELQSRGHLVCRLLLEKKKLDNDAFLQILLNRLFALRQNFI